MIQTKIKGFEYLISQCLVWFAENNPGQTNNFSKLKAIKLLFFITSANASTEDNGLFNLFDNYWALPFGHVESDVYENLGSMNIYKINNERITLTRDVSSNFYDDLGGFKGQIDLCVNKLKKEHPQLINYSAFELVEISHLWRSWITTYDLAQQLNRKSLKIPLTLLLNEPKFYSL